MKMDLIWFDDEWPGMLLTAKWMAKDQAEEEEEEAKFRPTPV